MDTGHERSQARSQKFIVCGNIYMCVCVCPGHVETYRFADISKLLFQSRICSLPLYKKIRSLLNFLARREIPLVAHVSLHATIVSIALIDRTTTAQGAQLSFPKRDLQR